MTLRLAACVAYVITTAPWASATAADLLWQTNARGDDIHVIDVASRKIVKRLVVGPNPHGIGTGADQETIFVSLERDGDAAGELLWIDPRSPSIDHRLEIGPEPHQLAVTPNGRFVYVPCRDERYWVIDAAKRRVVARIPTGGRPHNTTASPDGRFMYLSPMGSPRSVTIVDVEAGHRVVGRIPFTDSVRPPAIAADGRRFFQHVDGLNGFEVADIERRRVTHTARHSTDLGWFLLPVKRLGWLGPSGLKRCHGLAIRPGQQEIWSICGDFLAIHAAAPRYEELAVVALPAKGYWLTFDPEGGLAFVALSDSDKVAVIDAESRDILDQIPVGKGPKRNLVVSSE